MRLRHLVPFAILLAWQVAPFSGDSTTPRPRFSLSLGYALAQLEDYTPASFSCDGSQTTPARSERVDVRSAGVRADVVMNSGLRVTASGGNSTTHSRWIGGLFGGVEVAYEGPRVGVGAGASSESGATGYLRAGLAFNQVGQGRIGGFVGAAVVPAGGNGETSRVGFADLAIPTGAALDVLVRSQLGGGHQYTVWSLGLGARYHFGRPRPGTPH